MTIILSDPSYFMPPLIGVAVTFSLLVMASLWSRRDFATMLFCGVLVSMALVNIVVFGMRSSSNLYHALLWEKGIAVPTLAGYLLYYHFTLIYTHNTGQRRILRVSYLLLVVIAVLSPTDLIIKGMRVDAFGYAPIVGPVGYSWFIAGPLLALGGAYNLLKYYRACPPYAERKRLVYLAIAALFPIAGGLWDGFTDLPPIFIWSNLIFCILCTVAILKYRLLDIQIIVRRSLVYLLVSVAAAVPYVGVLFFLGKVVGYEIEAWWIHGVILLLLAIVLRPLYSRAQNMVDRLFFRDRYDYWKALEHFAKESRSIANPDELGSTLVKLVSNALKTSMVCLFLPVESKGDFVAASHTGLDKRTSELVISSRNPLLQWLKVHGRIISSEELEVVSELRSSAGKESRELERLRAELFVPIKAGRQELSGILVLGEKLGRQPYFDDDRSLLSALANQMSIHLQNVQLYKASQREVVDRKQAEEALRESESKYRELAESITDVFFGMDHELRYTYWNKASEELTGILAKDALEKHLYDIFPNDEATRSAEEMYVRVLRTRKPHHFINEYNLKGKNFIFEISAYPSKDGLSVFVKDITERQKAEDREKKLQEQLYLSSRLASIGELAAGVAHEINNPLTGIVGFSQRLLRRSASKETIEELQVIHDEARRAATVVRNLLTFAGRYRQKKVYSDTNDIVQRALDLRAYELKTGNIEVVTDLAPDLPNILVDFLKIQQVFLNIILNAEQVMREVNHSGKLHIKTEKTSDYVRVSITDDGPGIPASKIDKIFDPFFTTRAEKGGTGLGLSVCHGIVIEHGGRIYAKSKSGEGATFFVELPIIGETVNRK